MKENESTKEKKGIFIKILKIIEFIIMAIMVFLCTIIVVQRVTSNEYGFLGFRIFRVETGSMIPVYNIADVIIVKETDPNKIEVGDDLVYNGEKGQTKGKVITHRVVRKEEKDGKNIFYTKGVATTKEDPAVYEHQVMGTVQQKLYSITLIMNLLLNRYTLYFIIILPLTIYIFFAYVYGRERKIRKTIRVRNKKANDKEEKEKQNQKEKEEKIRQRLIRKQEIQKREKEEKEKNNKKKKK